ncbi:MAG TPA: type II toxin-antitoxin system prevent-host-death family antitoxin [Amoebophilaceae bacterium]|nr:type II toxin-antitoxin system prevent-host-death family antitoxin [Amoebophilaceae bacterium]
METITLSTFRETLKTSLQRIADNHEPMVVKRQRGEDMVVLSLEDFNAMQETLYLFSRAANTSPPTPK